MCTLSFQVLHLQAKPAHSALLPKPLSHTLSVRSTQRWWHLWSTQGPSATKEVPLQEVVWGILGGSYSTKRHGLGRPQHLRAFLGLLTGQLGINCICTVLGFYEAQMESPPPICSLSWFTCVNTPLVADPMPLEEMCTIGFCKPLRPSFAVFTYEL